MNLITVLFSVSIVAIVMTQQFSTQSQILKTQEVIEYRKDIQNIVDQEEIIKKKENIYYEFDLDSSNKNLLNSSSIDSSYKDYIFFINSKNTEINVKSYIDEEDSTECIKLEAKNYSLDLLSTYDSCYQKAVIHSTHNF